MRMSLSVQCDGKLASQGQEYHVLQEKYSEAEAGVKAIEAESTAEMARFSALESDQASLRQLASAKRRLVSECWGRGGGIKWLIMKEKQGKEME